MLDSPVKSGELTQNFESIQSTSLRYLRSGTELEEKVDLKLNAIEYAIQCTIVVSRLV